MNTNKISNVLWQLDPMRTGCAGDENMRDEYEFQAEEIASLVAAGTPLRPAIVQVFEKWFWEDCLMSGTDSNRLDAIVNEISNVHR
ncbi:hypothetical protein WH367_10635 [Comamonas sp. MYb21]|uniref:hypothetical protein n=1 Tax=Comamonas sp. MYb21 TaxID=1848648 RepID=UPI0030AFC957